MADERSTDADAEIERFTIEARGLTFDAIAAGPLDGTPVLFLHGFPESAAEWIDVMAQVASASYRCVAFDQRGYSPGARPDGVDSYRTAELAADVLAVADALGWSSFHLVGHDWGAIVAWVVADTAPDRLWSLTIVSVPHPRAFAEARVHDAEQQEKSAYLAFFQTPDVPEQTFLDGDADGLRRALAEIPEARRARHVEVLSDPGAMTAALNYYRAWDDSVDRLDPTTVPTLFVWSTEDIAIGRAGAEATEELVSGPYRFEELDGLSHWLPEVAPARVSAELLDHLSRFT